MFWNIFSNQINLGRALSLFCLIRSIWEAKLCYDANFSDDADFVKNIMIRAESYAVFTAAVWRIFFRFFMEKWKIREIKLLKTHAGVKNHLLPHAMLE